MRGLLIGGYDLHVHTSPSIYDRRVDDFELLKELDQYEMAGAVIKNHYSETAARAQIANKHAKTKAKLYGAITLNHNTGGLNPYALHLALLLGVKVVWLPTFHALKGMGHSDASYKLLPDAPAISVFDGEGKLLDSVYEVIDLIKQYDAILETGHLDVQESYAVATEALKRGAKVVINHADGSSNPFSFEIQTQLARKGAYIDKSWNNLWHGHITPGEMARSIKMISPENCIMTSDRGQKTREPETEALQKFVKVLLENGIKETEIQTMIRDNPRFLLGLN